MFFRPDRSASRSRRAAEKREALERQANEEIQAKIDRGRPAPEEWRRTRPRPAWTLPRPIRSRPLDVVTVRLDALPGSPRPARRARRSPVER